MEIKNQIEGIWKLKAFTILSKDGVLKKWGNNPHGLLIYAKGYMSVSINSTPLKKDTPHNHILFYTGTYKVKGNQIVHTVMNASERKRINQKLVRDIEISNSTLTLIGFGDYGTAKLIWEKVY
ncbi:lipocalin-like domain-containing protein [Cysteiniphilum sp. QT6929]|uniref:lipocalin-like domain-containing protein n=1 Tax=Cysteiniphilum sp. QT6929 TaxID=2975055 RepID=UPI0024B39CD7|nr:lipocalin-like domain-containing protein [Cysteiniphilum sp. QT6929]WHN66755.1 lipocalin-like domain-containing protein [Cysteiniphilum sp. QT6929]